MKNWIPCSCACVLSRWSEVGIQLSHRHKHSNSKLNLLFKWWGCHSSQPLIKLRWVGSHRICINTKSPPPVHRHPALLQPFPAVMEDPHSPIPLWLISVVYTLWKFFCLTFFALNLDQPAVSNGIFSLVIVHQPLLYCFGRWFWKQSS